MDSSEQKILQKHLARFLIDEVFNTVTEEDILRIQAPNVWTWRGAKLTEGQVNALKSEAGTFVQSGLWKVLRAELLFLAHKKGYVESKTEGDQIAGKMLEYLTNVIDTKLRRMGD